MWFPLIYLIQAAQSSERLGLCGRQPELHWLSTTMIADEKRNTLLKALFIKLVSDLHLNFYTRNSQLLAFPRRWIRSITHIWWYGGPLPSLASMKGDMSMTIQEYKHLRCLLLYIIMKTLKQDGIDTPIRKYHAHQPDATCRTEVYIKITSQPG